ncbi:hypothetical protein DFQ05_0720 [Winogradskyella wandonensis]|uniref:Uncharacterized protein n=1 Tax=Winogradskyella wandonensis TaxID=1442586 RepID=A0A4R1KX48_9FLAO|nr:hypothetical protein [Winogradskyella wandonensis]TCK69200.1 hypothetical protein DFQ05_0720 [Winogradskyella wandonensis]
MKDFKRHIIARLSAVLLVMAILAPSMVKFAHGFQNHEHEVCYGKSKSHLHEIDIDCDFYKFKLNNQYVHKLKQIDVLELEHHLEDITSQYHFVSDYQRLQLSLRGPPLSI